MPFALVAMGIVAAVFSGCGKKAPESKGPVADPPSVYMKDPAFRQDLAQQREARLDLTKARAELVAKMKAMVDAERAKLPGASDAAVKAALEKNAEWISLEKRVTDLNTALEENRRRTAKIVGDRIGPKKKKISK